eukprot:575708-Pelagomonas_calceolata.AAC.3
MRNDATWCEQRMSSREEEHLRSRHTSTYDVIDACVVPLHVQSQQHLVDAFAVPACALLTASVDREEVACAVGSDDMGMKWRARREGMWCAWVACTGRVCSQLLPYVRYRAVMNMPRVAPQRRGPAHTF